MNENQQSDSQDSIGNSFPIDLSQESFSDTFSRVNSSELVVFKDTNFDESCCNDSQQIEDSTNSINTSNLCISSDHQAETKLQCSSLYSFAMEESSLPEPKYNGLLSIVESHVKPCIQQPHGDVNLSPKCMPSIISLNNSPFVYSNNLSNCNDTPLIPFNKNVSDFAGIYEFSVTFGEKTTHASKNAPFTYSDSLKKLFANHQKKVPIGFTCKFGYSLDSNNTYSIRTTMVFKQAADSNEVITRCPLHINDSFRHTSRNEVNSDNIKHLVMAEGQLGTNVFYLTDEAGYESTLVRYTQPSDGKYFTIIYNFMCLTTCCNIKRRSTVLCFDLLDSIGQILARQSVDLVISTCPGRDRLKAEKKSSEDKKDTRAKKRKTCNDQVHSNKENDSMYMNILVHKDDYEYVRRYCDFSEYERKKSGK